MRRRTVTIIIVAVVAVFLVSIPGGAPTAISSGRQWTRPNQRRWTRRAAVWPVTYDHRRDPEPAISAFGEVAASWQEPLLHDREVLAHLSEQPADFPFAHRRRNLACILGVTS